MNGADQHSARSPSGLRRTPKIGPCAVHWLPPPEVLGHRAGKGHGSCAIHCHRDSEFEFTVEEPEPIIPVREVIEEEEDSATA
jgi:hypothetical protein